MSQLTANSIMPLISALPEEEQYALAEKLNKVLDRKAAPKKKKSVYDDLPAKFRPENRDMLVAEIIHGR